MCDELARQRAVDTELLIKSLGVDYLASQLHKAAEGEALHPQTVLSLHRHGLLVDRRRPLRLSEFGEHVLTEAQHRRPATDGPGRA